MRDVVNHTDDDQRAMSRQRAGESDRNSDKARQTVRKLTRIERLQKLGIIDADQAAACQMYSDWHEFGWAMTGCTASYGSVGGGSGSFDHQAKSAAQQDARDNYRFAKSAIPADLVALFEDVIFGTLGENEFRHVTANEQFRIGLAAWRLHGQIGHLIAVAA